MKQSIVLVALFCAFTTTNYALTSSLQPPPIRVTSRLHPLELERLVIANQHKVLLACAYPALTADTRRMIVKTRDCRSRSLVGKFDNGVTYVDTNKASWAISALLSARAQPDLNKELTELTDNIPKKQKAILVTATEKLALCISAKTGCATLTIAFLHARQDEKIREIILQELNRIVQENVKDSLVASLKETSPLDRLPKSMGKKIQTARPRGHSV